MISFTCVMVEAPPQLSEDVTREVLGPGNWFKQDIVIFAGHVIDGALMSMTEMT
jgi:hypothetical protein